MAPVWELHFPIDAGSAFRGMRQAAFRSHAMIRTILIAIPIAFATAWTMPLDGADHEHSSKTMSCAKSCDDCARTCDACMAHCGKMLAEGMKEHITTHRTCADCATTCRAAASIVARQGPMSELICTACADACKQCGEACAKMKDDPMMKECAEECVKCEKACREMTKHATAK